MSAKREYPMTAAALEELRAELKHKLEVEKPALAQRLKIAIEMGDLSENADYINAKEEQGFLQGRIEHLQEMIRGAVVIDEEAPVNGAVQLGSRITVLEQGEDAEETFLLVGRVEANPREGKISNESPLGSALLGKKVGDTVSVSAPGGTTVFRIVRIE